MNFFQKILKFIVRNFFKKHHEKELILIGKSHFLNFRPNYKNIKNINDLDYKIFSQFGEDGIIDYLLYCLKIKSPTFLEIGVGDYSESNTRFLYETTHPKGMIVDCIKNFRNKISKNIHLWKGDLTILEKKINSKNVNKVFQNNEFLKKLDLFSLDIDGIDYWVMKNLPDKLSKIVILEYNATFGPDLEVTVPNLDNFDRSIYHYSYLCFGASLKAYVNLMRKRGYIFLGTTLSKINAFFVLESEIKNLNLEIPDENDFSFFTNSNIRESRSENNDLSFLSDKNKLEAIRDCEVIDLSNNSETKVTIKELYNI